MSDDTDLSGYDPEVVEKAFWLQEKIRRDGLDGVRFMEAARFWAEDTGYRVVRDNVKKEIDKM